MILIYIIWYYKTPSCCCTIFKTQGKTLTKVIINFKKPIKGKIDFAYVYHCQKLKILKILQSFKNLIEI